MALREERQMERNCRKKGIYLNLKLQASKNDRLSKPANPESIEPRYKKETEVYSATVTFSRSQCLAGKPLDLKEAIRKAKKNAGSSLERNQETKVRTRNLQ